MANEFVHASVGTTMTQAEFEAIGLHVLNSQATGDLIYASSGSQLSRLGIGTANQVLITSGGIPTWSSTITSATLTTCSLGGNMTVTGYAFDAGAGYAEINSTGKLGLLMDGSIVNGGGISNGFTYNNLHAAFTSDGASTYAEGLLLDGAIIGHSGDSAWLVGMRIDHSITMTGNTAVLAQVHIDEPAITTGGFTPAIAASIYVKAAPTEGTVNAAIYVASGDITAVSGVFKVGVNQVVGAQGAAVANATGAGDVVAQLNALLARLRTHGLIAT